MKFKMLLSAILAAGTVMVSSGVAQAAAWQSGVPNSILKLDLADNWGTALAKQKHGYQQWKADFNLIKLVLKNVEYDQKHHLKNQKVAKQYSLEQLTELKSKQLGNNRYQFKVGNKGPVYKLTILKNHRLAVKVNGKRLGTFHPVSEINLK